MMAETKRPPKREKDEEHHPCKFYLVCECHYLTHEGCPLKPIIRKEKKKTKSGWAARGHLRQKFFLDVIKFEVTVNRI